MTKLSLRSVPNFWSTNAFSLRALLALGLGFTIAVATLHPLLTNFKLIPPRGNFYWPVAEVYQHTLRLRAYLIAAGVMLCFLVVIWNFEKIWNRLWVLITAAFLIVLGSNLIQGTGEAINNGLVNPIVGAGPDGVQYYADAIRIQNPLDFFAQFKNYQPTLHMHALTHPPGPPLTIYFLLKSFKEPAWVSIAIAAIAITLSMLFFYGLTAARIKPINASYLSLLYMLVPSIQIFYLATIDALIASFLLGVLYFFLHPNPILRTVGTAAFLFLSSLMTFSFAFIIPIMGLYEWIRHRALRISLTVVIILGAIYCLIYVLIGFNYLTALQFASASANPKGYLVNLNPALSIYVLLQDILEILVFFGPFLTFLFLKGMRFGWGNHSDLNLLATLGTLCLLAILLQLTLLAAGGVFRSGETARICQFAIPYLLFPIGVYLDRIKIGFPERVQLGTIVLGQGVIMQLLASYYW